MADPEEDDRVVKSVERIESYLFTREDLFRPDGTVKIAELKDHLTREGKLEKKPLLELCERVKSIFKEEPNLLKLEQTMTICGDIHGQFFDLIRMFEVSGDASPSNPYLFLGDYVDRGSFSMEVVTYLFSLKINLPKSFYLLRGNHECRRMTKFFNFRDECIYKYDEEVYNAIMDVFDTLPLAAVLAQRYFCVHAGLSPDLRYIEDLNKIDRFQEIPRTGAMCDLLWSDPTENKAESEKEDVTKWFRHNQKRGISYIYGKSAVKVFLKSNKIQCIIRGHTVEANGYFMHFQKSQKHVPKVITVFSAPNYCDIYKNQAAIIKLAKGVIDILTFTSSPHPYYLPNFKDVFSWSIPFITEKVTGILTSILETSVDVAEKDNDTSRPGLKRQNSVLVHNRIGSLKKKVMGVARMRLMLKKMREEQENIEKLKILSKEDKLPLGLIGKGKEAIQKEINFYLDKTSGSEKRSSTREEILKYAQEEDEDDDEEAERERVSIRKGKLVEIP